MSAEQWKPVPEWEGLYEVSDLGRVRSLDHVAANGHIYQGKILTPYSTSKGYQIVQLWDAPRKKDARVHRLVIAAFTGPIPDGLLVRHMNDNPADNRLANLKLGTPQDNMDDKARRGRNHWANRTHCSRGHLYSPENTYRKTVGGRECRECRRIQGMIYRAARDLAA